MIVIQNRDRELLRLCYEQQFLMTDHIQHYFRSGSYRACRMRVQELVEHKFLREESNSIFGRKPVYRTTSIGTQIALESGAIVHNPVRTLQLTTLVHDSLVTSVRLKLETLWDGRFVCERAIKSKDFKQIPDGIFFFPSGRGIAIEVENSDKGKSRFTRLLSRWQDTPGILFVLYVATSDYLCKSIKKCLPNGPIDQPMGVVTWEILKDGTPLVWTPRGEVDLFGRRTFT